MMLMMGATDHYCYVVVRVLCVCQVHGTLVRVPTVIAALIEQHQAPVLDLCESLGKSAVHL